MPPDQYQPAQVPAQPPVVPTSPLMPAIKTPSPKKSKLFLFISGGVALLVIIIIIVLVVSGGGKKPAPKTTTNSTSSSLLDPATALDVQQTSDGISNHLNQLDDSQSLPANALDDKTLGL